MSSPYRASPKYPRKEQLKILIKNQYSQKEFAAYLGICASALNLKLNGHYEFTAKEEKLITEKLKIKRENW